MSPPGPGRCGPAGRYVRPFGPRPRSPGTITAERCPVAMTTSSATSATMTPLSPDELHRIDAWWRAANYLSVGQIYLMANPLLREPLLPEHVKPRLLGHWGTTPGLNFVYAHLNRAIADARSRHDLHHRSRARRPRGRGVGLPRGHLQRDVLRHHPRRGGDGPAVQAVLVPGWDSEPRGARRRRARSTRAASWGTRSPTPTARRSTTQISSWLRSSATARRRPVRWRRAGTAPSSSIPLATERSCRSCT